MTVAPASPAHGTSKAPAGAPQESTPIALPSWLEGELRGRVEAAAASHGMTVAAVCEQWVREGLEHFEAQHGAMDLDGSGRCSLRTGTCSLGPVPLPVQQ